MSLQQLYKDMEHHLLADDQPSLFLKQIYTVPLFKEYPFSLLYSMRNTEQNPVHHPEGNVWNHVLMVVDEAAKVRDQSQWPRVLMWAAMLHDIGKPKTTKVRKGKITSYDHEKIGAELTKDFLAFFNEDQKFIDQVVQLVRYHMQILFVVNNLPYAEIEAMKVNSDIREVALLGFCDRMGRSHSDRQKEKANIQQFLSKCGVS